MVSYLAGEQWKIEAFRDGKDIYCETASRMFHVKVEKHGENAEYRQRGKQAELSCGYQGGVGALRAMGALEAGMKEEELQPLVEAWRRANPRIVKLWADVEEAAKTAVKEKTTAKTHGLVFTYRGGMLYIRLPSGRNLSYVKPRIVENRYGGECLTYMGNDFTRHWARIPTLGGKLVENCLSEGTLVITDKGLVPIECVDIGMRVWDGVEWVNHDGVICQGDREVINVNGIYMTPDHKILTAKGWCESGQSEGLNWAEVRLPDSIEEGRKRKGKRSTLGSIVRVRKGCNYVQHRTDKKKIPEAFLWLSRKSKIKRFNRTNDPLPYSAAQGGKQSSGQTSVALRMCMRKEGSSSNAGFVRQKNANQILRVYEGKTNKRSAEDARNVSSSSVGSLAQYEAKMSRPASPCISQLRRERHNGMRAMAGKFREFLGGYGFYVAERIRLRPNRQQRRLQPGKLSVDGSKDELIKSPRNKNTRNAVRKASAVNSLRNHRNIQINPALSSKSWMSLGVYAQATRFKKSVYDLLNAGPRHRFAVWNGERALIVSNCVQGISRDLLCHALEQLREMRIVAHIHDELLIESPMSTSVEEVCKKMAGVPSWASGLLLRADGYECKYYRKD